jgi:hypothetical protein
MRTLRLGSPQSLSRVLRAVALLAAALIATASALAAGTAGPAALVKDINPASSRIDTAVVSPLVASGWRNAVLRRQRRPGIGALEERRV